MSQGMDPRLVEHLCSRLCHDLVSPVGAINNGVELIEEAGGDPDGDAFSLIASSAEVAARRLQMFRLALGAAGGGGKLSAADARAVFDGWFRGGKVKAQFQPPREPPPGLLKLALLAALVAEEGLPYGGTLTIGERDAGLRLTAQGRQAALRPEVSTLLVGPLASPAAAEDGSGPGARAVLALYARHLARAYGFDLVLADADAAGFNLLLTPSAG